MNFRLIYGNSIARFKHCMLILTISRIRHDGINLAKLGRFEKEKKILDQSERNILDLFFVNLIL